MKSKKEGQLIKVSPAFQISGIGMYVTVKFAARSDDILCYALKKWEQFSLVYSLSLKKKWFYTSGSSF